MNRKCSFLPPSQPRSHSLSRRLYEQLLVDRFRNFCRKTSVFKHIYPLLPRWNLPILTTLQRSLPLCHLLTRRSNALPVTAL